MLASLTELKSYRVEGIDGDIGRIEDIVFPHNEWTLRYVVVTMEEMARQALLLSASFGGLNRQSHVLSANVRREQVTDTEPLDRSRPLDQRDEQRLHDMYGWPVYWWQEEHERKPMGGVWDESRAELNPDEPEYHGAQMLFASDLISVYNLEGEGGEVGVVQDFVVDDETWTIPCMVADAATGGGRVLVATDYVQTIDLGAKNIYATLSADVIRGGPAIESEQPVTPELQRTLREYYEQYTR